LILTAKRRQKTPKKLLLSRPFAILAVEIRKHPPRLILEPPYIIQYIIKQTDACFHAFLRTLRVLRG
jgi:hypothetical protein